MASKTDFLRNCPTVCYLLAGSVAVVFMCLGMSVLGCWLSGLFGLVVFVLLGRGLSLLLCQTAPEAVAQTLDAHPAGHEASVQKTQTKAAVVFYDTAPDHVDDLTKLAGVGPKLAERLNAIGVYQYAQIASWKKADVAKVFEQLGYKGKGAWVKQAKTFAKAER